MGTTRPNCKTMEKIKRDEIEIMAPVGCYESLAAAVQAGADSIYFGVEQLNMRARSTSRWTTWQGSSRPPARTASALT